MTVFQSEDRLRLKRLRSEKAIQLAMQNRWEEAAELNRQILELFPNDVDTYNRLGKSLMELGRYRESLEAYEQAAKADPTSTIAQKNIQRLGKLIDEEATSPPPPTQLDPRLFIEESGRTTVTTLVDLGAPDVIAKLTAGDQLKVEVVGNVVRVRDLADAPVGQIEPKLAKRLVGLLERGNKYSAAVTAADEQSVRIILRETHRDPSMGNRPSFPTAVTDMGRAYTRDNILRYEIEEEEEELSEEAEADETPRAEADLGVDEPLADEEIEVGDERERDR
jgi:tetratricopeptide (TPR) repeat protein